MNSIVPSTSCYTSNLVILSTANLSHYLALRHPQWVPIGIPTSLGGGVSNTVLLVDTAVGPVVVKQALPKLNVEQDWFADPARTVREYNGLQAAARFLPAGSLPQTHFLDPENSIYAMQAAPNGAVDWKQLLLSGNIDTSIALQAGNILGAIIAASWNNPALAAAFGDQTVFNQLRLDPYYKATAAKHPDLASFFQQLINSCDQRRFSLVHGDWSPKNLLVSENQVMAIDFEVVHFGDASFDAGFLLNHLMLKSFLMPQRQTQFEAAGLAFWQSLRQHLPASAENFEKFTLRHWGALMLARIDGKSPAEYIKDPVTKCRIREFARHLILNPPATIEAVWVARRNA